MTKYSTLINVLTSTFVKFSDREILKNFCKAVDIKFCDGSFTRDRIFSLKVLLGFILFPKVHSLFLEEMAYLDGIGMRVASVAAFAKRRGLIPAKYIEDFFREFLCNIYAEKMAAERWNGHLLLARDGTTYSIPDTKNLKEYFLKGRETGKSEQPLARGVVIKDVRNDLVVAANMECYGDDEIKLAIRELDKLPKVVSELSPVVIFDRKFCAYTLIEWLVSHLLTLSSASRESSTTKWTSLSTPAKRMQRLF